jgi:hypothetical protein
MAKKYDYVICTLNFNESDLPEFIVHHILLGFEHIFIYDDGSEPKTSDIISFLPDNIKSCVTINRLDDQYAIINGGNYNGDVNKLLYYDENLINKFCGQKQNYFINYFLKNYKNIAKYCYFCDMDEFIYLKDHNTIGEYLSTMTQYDIIFMPWLCYGTSRYIDKPKGLVIDNFRCHAKNYDNIKNYECGKCIVNINNIDESLSIHTINKNHKNYFEYDCTAPIFSLPVHVAHYISKGYKTLLKKKAGFLGRTHCFHFGCEAILIRGNSASFNVITNDHNMKKYVEPINEILKYELNDHHINYDSYTNSIIYNGNELTPEYIKENASWKLIEDIIISDNVKYVKINNI